MTKKKVSAKKRGVAIALSFVIALAILPFNRATALGSDNVVFDLSNHISGSDFDLSWPIQDAGDPSFTVVDNGIHVGNRSASWHAIDLLRDFEGAPLQIGDVVTISGTAIDAPSGTYMILGGAESPWNWITNVAVEGTQAFNIQTTLSDQHFAENQFVRLRLQTNDPGANIDFIISEWTVTRSGDAPIVIPIPAPVPVPVPIPAPVPTPNPAPVEDGESVLIYSLATDPYITDNSGSTDFSNATYLDLAGNPTVNIVGTTIELTDRTENWNTIDVLLDPLNLNAGGSYLFTATGTAPVGTEIAWHRSEAPWNHLTALTTTDAAGNWSIEAMVTYPFIPEMPAMRIQTNAAPEVDLTVTSINIYRLATSLEFNNVHNVDFETASYADYIVAGEQMTGQVVNVDGNNVFRLENITGDYTSGNGNYLQFNLPETIPAGTQVRISWDVFVPSAYNPGPRNIVGPGLNINGMFGQAPAQPTNDQDLGRRIGMDAWYTTTTEFMVSHEVGDGIEFLIFRFRVNDNEQQPSVLYVDNIIIESAGAVEFVAPEWDLTLPSLHQLFEPFFLLGNIYPTSAIMNQFDTRAAYLHHFNALTAENWHKPDFIAGPGSRTTRPTADEFDFTQADAIIDWAIANDVTLIGHALVWHSQTPHWLFSSAPGVPLTRSEALDNMEFYIRTVAEHWASRGVIDYFYSWDVANEVIASGGGSWGGDLDDWNAGDWRTQMRTDSGWWNAFANGYNATAGEHPSDFVFYAFYFARRYFPNSILYYNDYNEEIPAKRNAIAQMVEQINERWENHPEYDGRLLIERIGMQSHYHLRGWATNFDNVRPAIQRFIATGAGLSITELDITVGGFGAAAPEPADLPALFQEQAEVFARLFGYYLEFSDYISRVSLWGLADTQSWRAAGHPLLFDGQFNAKPAFQAIVDTVNNFTPAVAVANQAPVLQPVPQQTQILAATSAQFSINGETFTEQTSGTVSYENASQLIVPVRPVMESLGANVTWDNNIVTVELNGTVVDLPIGQNLDFDYGVATPQLIDHRAFVELGYLQYTFDLSVSVSVENQLPYVTIS